MNVEGGQGSVMEKYVQLAKDLGVVNAMIISPQDIVFDIRAILKCRWGCEDYFQGSIRCHTRNTTFQERLQMVNRYSDILLVHSHDARDLSLAVLEIERTAFLDGCHFAFAIRTCNLCKVCTAVRGGACPTPDRVRPCDQSFGIDVYKTVRELGLPCEVLQDKDAVQNRYGFVLLD
jgi:predicted metal-binding protein